MKITLENVYKLIVEQGKRLDAFEKNVDRRFARQFAHFDNEIKAIHKRLDQTATKADVNKIFAILDKMSGEYSNNATEIAALNSQTTRHESRIRKVAQSMAAYLKLP